MKINDKITAEYVTVGWKPTCKCASQVTANPVVLDPFNGSGTTGIVALANRCHYIGIELNPEYVAMADRRLSAATAQRNLL
jgi:tRNA/tmRNA/rRNA uracil-C5-methylase (TrmA/RlmC/RlmD family)